MTNEDRDKEFEVVWSGGELLPPRLEHTIFLWEVKKEPRKWTRRVQNDSRKQG